MKKLIFLLFFVLSFTNSYNQVIKGTIVNKRTQNPIGYASVYFDGTFVGAIADENGNFTLDVSQYASMPLTISAVGYYSVSVNTFLSDKPIEVILEPKIYDIKEIVVRGKSLERERKKNLKIFKEFFIETTSNAKKCAMLNETDITFNYYADIDTLKAFASKPILIENRALSYNVLFYLNKFEYYRESKNFIFVGTLLFNENITFKEQSKKSYDRRRRHAYLGSRMHFFRTLWLEDSLFTGFTLKDSANSFLSFKNIIKQDSIGRKYLKYKGNLEIDYYRSKSQILFLKEKLYFDKTGYFDPMGTIWSGELTKQLIADWLPLEYILE
jgi:hypothetical protein